MFAPANISNRRARRAWLNSPAGCSRTAARAQIPPRNLRNASRFSAHSSNPPSATTKAAWASICFPKMWTRVWDFYAPRFQDDKIALRKQQTLQAMKQRNDDSSAIEDREADFLAHGENFWANRYSTSNSIDSITALDIEKFHYAWFWPSN